MVITLWPWDQGMDSAVHQKNFVVCHYSSDRIELLIHAAYHGILHRIPPGNQDRHNPRPRNMYMLEGILVRSSGTHHPHHTPIGNCTAQVPDIFGQSVEQNIQCHEVPFSSTIKSLVSLTTWPFTYITEDVLKAHSSQQYCNNPQFPRHWVPYTSLIFHICCGA